MAGLPHSFGAVCWLILSLLSVCTMCEDRPICLINGSITEYDAKDHFCCENDLQRKDSGAECCHNAQKVYYPNFNVCCGLTTFDRYDEMGREYECCNGAKIRIDTQICCGDKTHDLPKGSEHMECCGRELINRTVDICCRNQQNPELVKRHVRLRDIDCCGQLVMDTTQDQCFWDKAGTPVVVGIRQALCAGKVINLSQQTCCNDVIYDEPSLDPVNVTRFNPRARCCGTTGFDPTHNKCCLYSDPAGSLIPNKKQLQCCHGNSQGYYNISSELCCGGNRVAKTTSRDQCCGSQSITLRSKGCCNHKPFDLDTEFCCEGIPSAVMSKTEVSKCCGGQRLENNSLCCDNTPVQKENHSDDMCCQDFYTFSYRTYTNSSMSCYNGKLDRRIASRDSVCNDKRYLPSKAVCCNGTIHQFSLENPLRCCVKDDLSETPFSAKHQICCHGNVYNMSENDSECCQGKGYNKMANDNPCTEKCGTRFHHKGETICCGRRVYEKATEGDTCCGNNAYFSNSSSCCGSVKYNNTTHQCCGGYAIIQRGSKTERCCKNFTVYNKKHGRCRNNLVQPKKNVSPLKNICRKKTWENLSGIQQDACLKKIAVRCTILKKKQESLLHVFTMKCKNLKRRLNEYHDSFAVQDKSVRLQLRVTSRKQMRCSRKPLVGSHVLMFLQRQATKVSERLYSLTVGDDDSFRMVEDRRQTREMIRKFVTRRRCKRIRRLVLRKQKLAS